MAGLPQRNGKTPPELWLRLPGSSARRRIPTLVPVPDEGPPERELRVVVDALCVVESGLPLEPGALPAAMGSWFLEHATHFRPVAYSALRLMDHLVRSGDEGVRAKVATALAPFVLSNPVKVEHLLLALAASSSREVRTRVVETLVRLLRECDEPAELEERWNERSEGTRELIQIARKLLSLRNPDG